MYTLPDEPTATPTGDTNHALVAGPLSPVLPDFPYTPAMVVMMPEAALTIRTTRLPLSTMYTLPDKSTATPFGTLKAALVAGPPSP